MSKTTIYLSHALHDVPGAFLDRMFYIGREIIAVPSVEIAIDSDEAQYMVAFLDYPKGAVEEWISRRAELRKPLLCLIPEGQVVPARILDSIRAVRDHFISARDPNGMLDWLDPFTYKTDTTAREVAAFIMKWVNNHPSPVATL